MKISHSRITVSIYCLFLKIGLGQISLNLGSNFQDGLGEQFSFGRAVLFLGIFSGVFIEVIEFLFG
jgi:hypothetical protein